ncbi:hypothetical protein V491_00241 [Pseudogymnoascus sp. VKM F-3775]|nr:hypothetical protein V491_00241 [Pseudogymnoascus sp. VKM F-3775]
MQQEQIQELNSLIDLQILATQESFSFTQALEDSQQPQPPVDPLDGIDGIDRAFATQDAETWLDNMINNNDSEWMRNTVEVASSPPTSIATVTRIALGTIFRGCKCPVHQEIYSDWPTYNAELKIAICMKKCVYCSRDFITTAELHKHMRKTEYARRNLRVYQETCGRGSSTTPAWTSILAHRSDSEPLCQWTTTPMVGHQELRILQYNVQKSRDVVLASLFQDPRILEYNVLAIQEPWRNPFIATSYNPLKAHFQLTYLDDTATRSTIYRNANWGIPVAQPLLTIIEDFHLDLLTAPGTTTYRWKSGELTIDLAFASGDVTSRMTHLPSATELQDKESIDEYIRSIIKALNAGIDMSTLWSNPSPHSIPGKGLYIQKTFRNTHRQRVEEASALEGGLWKLVKWAKNRHTIATTSMPTLMKPDGELAHYAEEKAETLRQFFFPLPLRADLSDINGYKYPLPIECPEITLQEIVKAVRRAAPNKAPGTDDIINGILHQTLDILLPSLHRLFNACLQLGYCPAHFKETITVALRKPGKDDYSQPKLYRPIALLNTLGKALEALQEYTAPVASIKTGIPQGSRLSPILYLFYNADLIEACKTEDTEAIGYIDDASILAVGPSAQRNCKTLKAIHQKAEE